MSKQQLRRGFHFRSEVLTKAPRKGALAPVNTTPLAQLTSDAPLPRHLKPLGVTR